MSENGKDRLVVIEINTREENVPHGKISFEEVVKIAFPAQAGQPNQGFTVTWHLKQNSHEHKLLAGMSVEVHERMVFLVGNTHES